MATPEQALAQFLGRPLAKPGTNVTDIAKFILQNSKADPIVKSSASSVSIKPEPGSGRPSLIGRVFDILSRPNYAVAEAMRDKDENFFKNIGQGLSGKEKTTFSDVLSESGMEKGWQRGALGFALDIGLDPTTYIGAGLIGRGLKAAGIGKETVLPARKIPVAKLPEQEVPEAFRKPEKIGLDLGPKVGFAEQPPTKLSRVTLPGQTELPLIVEGAKATKTAKIAEEVPVTGQIKGQLPFKFPGQTKADFELSKPATEIVDGVAKGSVTDLIRTLPKPKPALTPRDALIANKIVNSWKIKRNTLNPMEQVKLFRKAEAEVRRVKLSTKIKDDDFLRALIAVEDGLESKGAKAWDGVKLSDVIVEVGNTEKVLTDFPRLASLPADNEVKQAVNAIRARTAVEDAPKVQAVVTKAAETIDTVENSKLLSDSKLKAFGDNLRKNVKAEVKNSGVRGISAEASDKLVKAAMSANPAQVALERKLSVVDDIFERGAAKRAEVNGATTAALEKSLGKLPKEAVTSNKAIEWFMSRIATWWGQKDLRPLSLNAIAGAKGNAGARAVALRKLFDPFTEEQAREAWNLARGLGEVTDPSVQELSFKISRMMDNMFESAGVSSVAKRAMLEMGELNKVLARYSGFRFTNKKVKDPINGETHDYSKEGWLNSWKAADFTEHPQQFIWKMQNAVDQAAREKALFDEIGERFGSNVKKDGFRVPVRHPYLVGYYFESDLAKQIPRVINDLEAVYDPKSPLIRHYDKILSAWKSGVTIYSPSHHIRNVIGDVNLAWMDGVNNVRPYNLASKVLYTQRPKYRDLVNLDQLVEVGALSKQLYRTPKPSEVIFKNKSGVGFSAEQIYIVAHQKGLLLHATTVEDIIDEAGGLPGLTRMPLGGRGQHVARSVSELRDHWVRLAHFIDKVEKSRGKDLDQIFEAAARRTRKWHPDGLDLTMQEKQVMRRLIPFYSWVRKAYPLVVEGAVMNPGKTLVYPKLMGSIQEAQGIETEGRGDPFPLDQMFPDWIKEKGIGPVGKPGGVLDNFLGKATPGYSMLNPSNPLIDLVGEWGGMGEAKSPVSALASAITPAARIPAELFAQEKFFSGAPIQTKGQTGVEAYSEYLGEQIPIASIVQRLSGVGLAGPTRKGEKHGLVDTEAIVNYLTAAGVRATGPYQKQAEFEKKEREKKRKEQAG